MTPPSNKPIRTQAADLVGKGEVDSAVALLLKNGFPDDAAAILARSGAFQEAGDLLLESLNLSLQVEGQLERAIKHLDEEANLRLSRAAQCYAKAKEYPHAEKLFVILGEQVRADEMRERQKSLVASEGGNTGDYNRSGLGLRAGRSMPRIQSESARRQLLEEAEQHEEQGDPEKALECYAKAGEPREAARVAYHLDRRADAAFYFSEAGMFFRAGLCALDVSEKKKALEFFSRVGIENDLFRKAGLYAARLAVDLEEISFSTETMLVKWSATPPEDKRQVEAYYRLSQLFKENRLLLEATQTLQQIVEAMGEYKDVVAQLDILSADGRQDLMAAAEAHVTVSNPSFNENISIPGLMPPPELPDLPPIPSKPIDIDTEKNRSQVEEREPSKVTPPSELQPDKVKEEAAQEKKAIKSAKRIPKGTVLAGRYRVEEKVGRGGMAAVYRATDMELEESVAIKVFARKSDSDVSMARFKQEVSLTRRLNHPNIVSLYDIGEHEGLRFITMELLSGRDLSFHMKRSIELPRGLGWMIQVCRGLHIAHKQNIVHRDIKPANIFVCDSGQVKLMDFGIAKKQNVPGLTVGGLTWGTPRYMAPEQIRGFSDVTASSDLYAVGVIAFQMFTGELPFDHEEQVPLLMMHIHDPPPKPTGLEPSIPQALEDVILKLLAKKPGDRYADCRILTRELQQIAKELISV